MRINNLLLIALAFMLIVIPFGIAEKQCVAGSTYINIISPNEYGVGETINNITLKLDKNTFTCGSTSGTIILYEGTTQIEKVSSQVFNSNCEIVNTGFNYLSQRSGDYKVEVLVKAGTQEFKTSKNIKILPAINTKLTCSPIPAYINRDITCTWISTKAGTLDTISTTAQNVVVKQGNSELSYNSAGSNAIKFSSSIIGSIKVSMDTIKDGYVKDSDTFIIDVESLTIASDFLIDNKDYKLYTGFDTGAHTLELRVKESGTLKDVSAITSQIITPTNQQVPVTFNKYDTGVYKTTFNLESPGQTYTLEGNLVFPGNQDSVPFRYALSTVGSVTEDLGGLYIGVIVAIVGSIIVAVVVVILLVRRKPQVQQ